jgi:hypothetical protein
MARISLKGPGDMYAFTHVTQGSAYSTVTYPPPPPHTLSGCSTPDDTPPIRRRIHSHTAARYYMRAARGPGHVARGPVWRVPWGPRLTIPSRPTPSHPAARARQQSRHHPRAPRPPGVGVPTRRTVKVRAGCGTHRNDKPNQFAGAPKLLHAHHRSRCRLDLRLPLKSLA